MPQIGQAALVSSDTNYGKEMWRWEHDESRSHPKDPTVRGMGAASFKPFPAMVYKITAINPVTYETFQVRDEAEQRNLQSRGFVAGGLQAAYDAYQADQQALAVAAAHRNYEDRNLSPNAKAESLAHEEQASGHVGEIPRTPAKRAYVRKQKAVSE